MKRRLRDRIKLNIPLLIFIFAQIAGWGLLGLVLRAIFGGGE